MKRQTLLSLLTLLCVAAFSVTGCRNSTEPVQDESLTASIDAADVISGALGSDNGGLNDQLTDITDLANGGFNFSASSPDELTLMNNGTRHGVIRNRVYDAATQTWTITIVRNFDNRQMSGNWSRQYRVRFSRAGVGQQFLRVGTSTADRVDFEIVSDSCSGNFKSPRVTHKLNRLEGSLRGAISFADTANPTVTINSVQTYRRAAVDTLTIGNSVRTSNHSLTMTLNNVVVPLRPARRFQSIYARATSGTISGTYQADITFTRGESYDERQVNREYSVDLSEERNGRFPISVRGRRGEFRGNFEPISGWLIP